MTDYLVIKAYNEQNQTTDPCVVSANSGFKTTAIGILSYIKTGVDPGNLILGLPWFGYDYPCSILSDDGETCKIEKILFREAKECSDAAGKTKGTIKLCTLECVDYHCVTVPFWCRVFGVHNA